MYKTIFYLFIGIGVFFNLVSFNQKGELANYLMMDYSELALDDALFQLGDDSLLHHLSTFDKTKAENGEQLIKFGRLNSDTEKTKLISKHFVCTDCHNLTSEFDNIASEDPAERLEYAKKNGLPFLPGSTLWGIYNRTSFYNDDYVEKYGDLATESRNSLEKSIQLCAEYCSAGRVLADWELDAIIHYFKKNELHLSDLDLSTEFYSQLSKISSLSKAQKTDLIKELKSKYRQGYSATFLPTMDVNKRQYGIGGNIENGEIIYEKSCLFCHENKRVTYLGLNKGKLTGRMFWRKIETYSDKSLYQIIRYGTYSKAGRKQYMPRYTEEKMSDKQINDLVAYIRKIARK